MAALTGTLITSHGLRLAAAWLVSIYWATYAIRSVVFSQDSIAGLFFPFYFGFILLIVVALLGHGLMVLPTVFWALFIFFGIVLISLADYAGSVDADLIQQIVIMLIAPFVLFNIQSIRGLRLVAVTGCLVGLGLGVWIIVSSAQGGFEYRGDIDANQNIAAFIVGLSLTLVLAMLFHPSHVSNPWARLGLLLSAGVPTYAVLLLASRGMSIALALAAAGMFIHAARIDTSVYRRTLIILIAAAFTLFLPGGDGLLQRFTGESVETAGDRTPIWAELTDAITGGTVAELVFGHGFNASRATVLASTAIHTSSHNAYLSMTYDYGLVGLLAFLALHVVVLVLAARSTSSYAVMATGIVWFLFGANMTTTTPDDFAYWLALGLAMACASFGTMKVKHRHKPRPAAGA